MVHDMPEEFEVGDEETKQQDFFHFINENVKGFDLMVYCISAIHTSSEEMEQITKQLEVIFDIFGYDEDDEKGDELYKQFVKSNSKFVITQIDMLKSPEERA